MVALNCPVGCAVNNTAGLKLAPFNPTEAESHIILPKGAASPWLNSDALEAQRSCWPSRASVCSCAGPFFSQKRKCSSAACLWWLGLAHVGIHTMCSWKHWFKIPFGSPLRQKQMALPHCYGWDGEPWGLWMWEITQFRNTRHIIKLPPLPLPQTQISK